MRREQKILATALWGVAVAVMIGVVGMGVWARRGGGDETVLANESQRTALQVLFDAPSFSLTDQEGRTLSDQTLRGQVWVGMLFFTSCPGVCPMMTARMTDLQKAVPLPDVKIVSFSVDPRHDTPEVMKQYAQHVGADLSRWYFLTGPEPTMFEVARGLKLAAEPASEGKPITHSAKVLLIDRAGHVRGIYDTNDDDSMKNLANDARTLAGEKGKVL